MMIPGLRPDPSASTFLVVDGARLLPGDVILRPARQVLKVTPEGVAIGSGEPEHFAPGQRVAVYRSRLPMLFTSCESCGSPPGEPCNPLWCAWLVDVEEESRSDLRLRLHFRIWRRFRFTMLTAPELCASCYAPAVVGYVADGYLCQGACADHLRHLVFVLFTDRAGTRRVRLPFGLLATVADRDLARRFRRLRRNPWARLRLGLVEGLLRLRAAVAVPPSEFEEDEEE
ncbi:hypothetical protein [Planobispora takensis]|uniref:Uncharacterized protein n=1 Tax=Planobispora takensis TaxID=1367882 RepID=A0A8J3SUV6_9ACTN|nr:hypothetical protein [Planobispora takensis]GIH99175.1 hypothetical protein Pta02_11840 [Planobispora takensis]